MTAKDGKWLVALALLVAACGDDGGPNSGDDDAQAQDAAGPYADAGPSPGDPTYDVAGGWEWTATRTGESVAFVTCDVIISNGAFDITCPQGDAPRVVGAGCTQLRDDLHIYGQVGYRLDGMLDTIVEYDGDSCATYGYTIGAPYPLPAFAQMAADHIEQMSLGTFLHDLGGRWDWALDDARNPDAGIACQVHFGLDLVDPGVKIEISCPTGAPAEVIPGCTAQPFFAVLGHLVPGQLDGQLAQETHHEGGSCGNTFPPVVREPLASMQALSLQ